MNLDNILKEILPFSEEGTRCASQKWDRIAKPLHSLGLLEDAIIKIAGITGTGNVVLDKKCVLVVCSDNGVTAENVTQTDSSVTKQVAVSLKNHTSGVCLMAEVAGADIFPADVGMFSEVDGIFTSKCGRGTKNIAKEPAMSVENAVETINTGIRLVKMCKEKGYHILATGEMGIGNTTTSSAVTAALLKCPVESVTGPGAGLTSDGIVRKTAVIKHALALHNPDPANPIDIISKVGGYDIAAMTGIFIGGALYRIPVVIDGFISSAAALCAVRLCPLVKDYMLPSHISGEPAGALILNTIGLKPLLTCGMRLGEGTGAVALFPLLDMALSVYHNAGTFEDIDVEQYKELN